MENNGFTPFTVVKSEPVTMAQLYIDQQEQDRSTMITVADNKNDARGTPPLP